MNRFKEMWDSFLNPGERERLHAEIIELRSKLAMKQKHIDQTNSYWKRRVAELASKQGKRVLKTQEIP